MNVAKIKASELQPGMTYVDPMRIDRNGDTYAREITKVNHSKLNHPDGGKYVTIWCGVREIRMSSEKDVTVQA